MHKSVKAAVLIVLLLLTGCSAAPANEGVPKTEKEITSMEAKLDLSYEVPVSSPNKKLLFFVVSRYPRPFRLSMLKQRNLFIQVFRKMKDITKP